MENCLFRINTGNESFPIMTEQQLKTFLALSNVKNFADLKIRLNNVKWSLAEDQSAVLDNVRKKDTQPLIKNTLRTSDSEYEFAASISACRFIETEFKQLGGLQMAVNDEDFRKWVIQSQVTSEGITPEEREKIADTIIESWDQIEADSIDLHNVMPILWNYIDKDIISFTNALRGFQCADGKSNMFEKLDHPVKNQGSLRMYELLYSQMQQLNLKINGLAKTESGKSKTWAGLHFSSKIKDQLRYVGVHVDKILMDPSGRLTIVNFKFCLSDPSTWCANKKTKYQYEMAMIKKILEQNGLKVSNATFVNIPITLSYDEGHLAEFKVPNSYNGGIETYNVNTSRQGAAYSPLANRETELEKYFEAPKVTLDPLKLQTQFQESTLFMKVLNPEHDISDEGMRISAKQWIRDNIGTNIIFDSDKQQYKVILPNGEEKYVNDLTDPKRNQEILDIVKKNIETLSAESPIIMSELVKSIKNAYQTSSAYINVRGFRFNQGYIQSVLSKYFKKRTNEKGEEEFEWELLSEEDINNPLADRGILLFLNKRTKQLDTVIASPYYCKALIPLPANRKNILGYYCQDMEGITSMQASYGNMELMRAAAILNEIRKDLPPSIKLGAMNVVTPHNSGEGYFRDARTVVNEYSKICKYLNTQSKENNFKSNFVINDFVDPLSLIFDTFNDIMDSSTTIQKVNFSFDLEGLKNAKTIAGRIQAIEELIEAIIENGRIGRTPQEIIANMNSADKEKCGLANIYAQAVKYLNYYTGFKQAQVQYISKFERLIMPQYANSDENVRHLNSLYIKALDRIASQFQEEYNPIRTKIYEFYNKKGFSSTTQFLGKNANSLFEKFFEKTPDGKKTWKFVNPYDVVSSRELDQDEKEMLKVLLYQFNKIRSLQSSTKDIFKFGLKDINSQKYQDFIEGHKDSFFKIPLEKAASDIGYSVAEKVKGTKEVFNKIANEGGVEYAKEFLSGRQRTKYEDGQSKRQESVYNMAIENQIALSEVDEYRTRMLKQHDEDYFETNLEYLLIDYIESSVARKNLNQVSLYGKCMLFQMYLQGESEGANTQALLRKSAEDIEDYIKINIYNKDLLDDLSEQFVNVMSSARKLMTNLYIAANLRSGMRDTFEGIWQNFSRTISHYQTDLTAKYVMEGYKEAVQNVFKSDRSLNICSELCLRYRLSNVDAAKISERAKSGRGGLANPKTMSFSTLRAPDFLNRMVLFVARCKQDGVWDAYSMEEDQLKYNWKKDKRFDIFSRGESAKSHPDYAKQQALYYNLISTYNQDHGTQLTFKDNLPEPYTADEISKFKEFANKIYGAYDKSQKSKYEFLAVGMTWGVFSTWMNGHTAAWFARKGYYDSFFRTTDEEGNALIKHNEAGNELWFEENGNGNIYEKRSDGKFYDQDTGQEVEIKNAVPVQDKIPEMVQGIAYTLQDIYNNTLEYGLSAEAFKKNIWKYRCNRENLRKFGWDALMASLFASLFGFVFTPMYEEHKKNKDSDNLLADGFIELIYKAGRSSYDGFLGPIAMYDYVVNNVEPSAANVSTKLISDLYQTAIGNKGFKNFVFGYVPVLRTFKDTATMANGGSLNKDND